MIHFLFWSYPTNEGAVEHQHQQMRSECWQRSTYKKTLLALDTQSVTKSDHQRYNDSWKPRVSIQCMWYWRILEILPWTCTCACDTDGGSKCKLFNHRQRDAKTKTPRSRYYTKARPSIEEMRSMSKQISFGTRMQSLDWFLNDSYWKRHAT